MGKQYGAGGKTAWALVFAAIIAAEWNVMRWVLLCLGFVTVAIAAAAFGNNSPRRGRR